MKETETERLILRKIRRDDMQAIFDNWASDPDVAQFVTWNTHKSIRDTEAIMNYWLDEYDKDNCYRWGIVCKEDGVLFGMMDVVGYKDETKPVIGYCSGKKYWNRGYMTEALTAVIGQLFEDGYTDIRIEAVAENKASNKVIKKAGGEFIGCRIAPLSLAKPDPVEINSYRIIHNS